MYLQIKSFAKAFVFFKPKPQLSSLHLRLLRRALSWCL
jgi:hypothetical protein